MKDRCRTLALIVVACTLPSCGGTKAPPPEAPVAPAVEEEAQVEPATEAVEAQEPAAEEVAEPASEAGEAQPAVEPPAPEAPPPLEGILTSRKGKNVVVNLDEPVPPPDGSKAVLYKFFEKQLGPFATSGWLAIANVTVTGSDGSTVKLEIDEELSVMEVNGKKVNHFTKGTLVKLEVGVE